MTENNQLSCFQSFLFAAETKKSRALGHDATKNNQVSFVFGNTDHPQSLRTLMITEYMAIRKGKKMALDLVSESLRVLFW
jgi:hypothetical protein